MTKSKARLNALVVILAAVATISVLAGILFRMFFYPTVEFVRLSNAQIVGDSEVCPGQTVTMSYTMQIVGRGVFEREETVWSVDPPKTVIYSDLDRFIVEEGVTQQEQVGWFVPEVHIDRSLDALVPLEPGEYRRLVAILSPNDPNKVSLVGATFTVRDDCPDLRLTR